MPRSPYRSFFFSSCFGFLPLLLEFELWKRTLHDNARKCCSVRKKRVGFLTGMLLRYIPSRWRHTQRHLHEQSLEQDTGARDSAPVGNLLLVHNTVASTRFPVGVADSSLVRALVGALSVGICSERTELSTGYDSPIQSHAPHKLTDKHVKQTARLRGCTCMPHTCQTLLMEGDAGSIFLDRLSKSCSATYNFSPLCWHQGLVPSQPQHCACPNTQRDAPRGKHKQRS